MALSCVYRSGQRFGVNYIIDLLMGREDERILRNRHNQLSTFGIGKALSNPEWRSLFRQLIALGYVHSDIDRHGALILQPDSKPLLKGEQTLHLRVLVKSKKTQSSTTRGSKREAVEISDSDAPLFEALRNLRTRLAQQQGVPPYVILHDKTLHELCRQRPLEIPDLADIPGIGARKLELYGNDLVQIIEQHPL